MRELRRVFLADQHSAASASPDRRPRLLIVEPDTLTRWSLENYLTPWYEVCGVEKAGEAERILAHECVDALILSEVPGRTAAERVECLARRGNPSVHVVHIGTEQPVSGPSSGQYLEKPFELSRLAGLLGVARSGDSPKVRR